MHTYALHNMANNHPYVSSSGTPVSAKFAAMYVGMVVSGLPLPLLLLLQTGAGSVSCLMYS